MGKCHCQFTKKNSSFIGSLSGVWVEINCTWWKIWLSRRIILIQFLSIPGEPIFSQSYWRGGGASRYTHLVLFDVRGHMKCEYTMLLNVTAYCRVQHVVWQVSEWLQSGRHLFVTQIHYQQWLCTKNNGNIVRTLWFGAVVFNGQFLLLKVVKVWE